MGTDLEMRCRMVAAELNPSDKQAAAGDYRTCWLAPPVD